jgi:hypothetical protein
MKLLHISESNTHRRRRRIVTYIAIALCFLASWAHKVATQITGSYAFLRWVVKISAFVAANLGIRNRKVIGKWEENKMCSSILCILANNEIKWGWAVEGWARRRATVKQKRCSTTFSPKSWGYKTTWDACASPSSTGSPASYSGNTEFNAWISWGFPRVFLLPPRKRHYCAPYDDKTAYFYTLSTLLFKRSSYHSALYRLS